MNTLDAARALQSSIVKDRRHLHEHPELSFKETETARFAAKRLKQFSDSVQEGIGITGVIADLGAKGKNVAIRADMDALPIDEETALPFSSKNQGIMHACGHDAHVACALAAAEILKERKISGRVRFLMQPSEEFGDEEGKSGAERMIEEGVMDDVDYVIGQHVITAIPAGKVAILDGPAMASSDNFEITITGKGGHGAYPHTTVDAVSLAGLFLNAVDKIVSRKINANEQAVVSICSVRSSSDRTNIISESVRILGTMRSFDDGVRTQLRRELENACKVVIAFGGDYELKYLFGYEAVVNNSSVAAIMRQVATEFVGAAQVVSVEPQMGSEDFSLFAKKAPGAFMFLGVGPNNPKPHHSPGFAIEESPLYLGSAILAETAIRLMSN
jgi:amidohydrolase